MLAQWGLTQWAISTDLLSVSMIMSILDAPFIAGVWVAMPQYVCWAHFTHWSLLSFQHVDLSASGLGVGAIILWAMAMA